MSESEIIFMVEESPEGGLAARPTRRRTPWTSSRRWPRRARCHLDDAGRLGPESLNDKRRAELPQASAPDSVVRHECGHLLPKLAAVVSDL